MITELNNIHSSPTGDNLTRQPDEAAESARIYLHVVSVSPSEAQAVTANLPGSVNQQRKSGKSQLCAVRCGAAAESHDGSTHFLSKSGLSDAGVSDATSLRLITHAAFLSTLGSQLLQRGHWSLAA
jgi:hypothetical protein